MSESPGSDRDARLMTDYSIYADSLDVDGLLSIAAPRSDHRVWRVGQSTEFGLAQSSGLSIEIFAGGSAAELFAAIREFLEKEEAFLRAAQAFVRGNVACSLSTWLPVLQNHVPVTLELPAALMSAVAKRGIDWSVNGLPCSEDGHIAVGVAPSNNRVHLTRSAPASESRLRRGPCR